MSTSNMGLYAVAAAIAFVGALWVGVPLGVLAPLLFIVACPLMMLFMMKGMGSGGREDHGERNVPRDQQRH